MLDFSLNEGMKTLITQLLGSARRLYICFIVISVILTSCHNVNSLVIIFPPEIAGQEFLSPRQTLVGPVDWNFDFTGQLAFSNETDLTNKIVLMRSFRSDQEEARKFSAMNPLGLISMTLSLPRDYDFPGFPAYNWDGTNTRDLNLPMVIVSARSAYTLLDYVAKYETVMVRITSNDPNPWGDMLESGAMVTYSVILPIVIGSCLIFAVFKQVMWIRRRGFQKSIPQTVLWFEIVANIIRLLGAAVDPLQSRTIYPFILSQMLFTLSWPFSVVSVLLISFYWHELFAKVNVTINAYLDRLKIVFWVIFGVLLGLECALAITRGVGFGANVFIIVSGVMYIVVVIGTVIFFAITGIRLFKALKKTNRALSDPEKRMRKLKRTSDFIWMSASALLLWAIGVAIGGLSVLFYIPYGFFSIWFIGNLLLTFLSFSQIFALQVPRAEKSSAMSSNSTSKQNATGHVELR
jgi:hypothetical protein